MAEVKVLIACHDPILHGPIGGNSFKKNGKPQPNFQYDYVNASKLNEENGWVTGLETDALIDKYYGDGLDDDEVDRLIEEDEAKIREKRKGTFTEELNKVKQLPGHSNTQTYGGKDWRTVPDNTYDIIYTYHCPIYGGPGVNFDIVPSPPGTYGFPFNNLLKQAQRVLKAGGFLIVADSAYKNKEGKVVYPLHTNDPVAKNPPGFVQTYTKLARGNVSEEFPEFWMEDVSGYFVNDLGNVVPKIHTEIEGNRSYGDRRTVFKFTKQSPTEQDTEQETLAAMRTGGRKTYRMPRKYSRSYCRKTTCKKMGFTQRSSCRPYKNCFRSGRK